MTPPATAVDQGFDAALEFFGERESRCAVLARRLGGHPRPHDEALTDHLIRERRRRTRMDGSMGGSLVDTAWVAWELLDLGCPPDHAAVVRTLGFVLGRQDTPGRFGEGCDDERHEGRRCHHYVSGFFSPGPRDESIAPLSFPSGITLRKEEPARFAASCFALRSALRGGAEGRAAIQRHLDSLLQLEPLWSGEHAGWPPDLMFFALGALAYGPLSTRPNVDRLANGIIGRQLEDGAWRGADLWHALEMLLSFSSAAARRAVGKAAPLVLARQEADGGFDGGDEERTLIALRVLALARA